MTTNPAEQNSDGRVRARCDACPGLKRFEIGGKSTGVGIATRGVWIEGLVDDRDKILVDAGAAEYAVTESLVGGGNLLQGAKLPEHGADGEDVGTLVDVLAALLLGSHVGWGAEDAAGGGEVDVVVGA